MPDRSAPDPNELLKDRFLEDIPSVDGFKVLDPVVLYSRIGQGGMGAVYRGRHLKLDIDVAVKCMKPGLALENQDFIARFKREAKIAAAVSHQNLIRVFDVNESHGLHYIVMEYVQGESARERVERKGPLSLDEALTLIIGAADGVAAAHGAGIVHRDIKPDNIMISSLGEVKVADLGLATSGTSKDNLETRSGILMGTLNYMPPEQCEDAKSVTPAADVYSLTATLFFLLTGKHAIKSGTPVAVIRRVCEDGFPDIRPHCPEIPVDLASLIKRATNKDPGERPQDAQALSKLLSPFLSVDSEETAFFLHDIESEHDFDPKRMVVSPPPEETIAQIKRQREESGSNSFVTPQRDAVDLKKRTVRSGQGTNQDREKSKTTAFLIVAVVILTIVSVGLASGWWGDRNEQNAPERQNSRANKEKASEPSKEEHRSEIPKKDKPSEFDLKLANATALLEDPETLKQGIQSLRSLYEQDKSHEGAVAALSQGLQKLLKLKESEGDLGGALLLARECMKIDTDATVQLAESRCIDSIKEALRRAIKITAPDEDARLASAQITVNGSIALADLNKHNLTGFKLSINENRISFQGPQFAHTLQNAPHGSNSFQLSLEDSNGLSVSLQRSFVIDLQDPVLEFIENPARPWVRTADITFTLKVRESSKSHVSVFKGSEEKKVRLAHREVPPESPDFQMSVAMSEGLNELTFRVEDEVGRSTEQEVAVRVDTIKPVIVLQPCEEVTTLPSLLLEGDVKDKNAIELRLDDQHVEVASDGSFRIERQLIQGTNSFRFVARDEAGNESTATVKIKKKLPPTPQDLLGQVNYDFGINLKDIVPGTFLMGSPETEAGHEASEKQHRVTLTSRFFMADCETTRGQWMKVREKSPSLRIPWPDYASKKQEWLKPATHVTWQDAHNFIIALNKLTKNPDWEFRLPTEAEFEYCCRAGSSTAYSFGEDAAKLDQYAWFTKGEKQDEPFAHPVKLRNANKWLLHDMHGNVKEWCWDYARAYGEDVVDPIRLSHPRKRRAIRGGGADDFANDCRSASRKSFLDSYSDDVTGFRVVLVPIKK